MFPDSRVFNLIGFSHIMKPTKTIKVLKSCNSVVHVFRCISTGNKIEIF